MTFLNPLMLFGGLAVGIPILLHFFYRTRYRPVPWAAMKFLRLSIEQTSRRLRFQELILLLLRILVCLLLAFALARPASKAMVSSSGRGESVDAVIIIDTSYSMSAEEGVGDARISRLDQARKAALKIVDNLPPKSTVRVVTCSDKAELLGPIPSSNLDRARYLISTISATGRATDYLAGFAEAAAILDKVSGGTKEIYLVSDMQRSGWNRQSNALTTLLHNLKQQATLFLVRVGVEKLRNVAITSISTDDIFPHTNSRTGFSVTIKNKSHLPVQQFVLTLAIDGEKSDDPRVIDHIGPGEDLVVDITAKVDKRAGWRVITAQLQSTADEDTQSHDAIDSISMDNRFQQMIFFRERVRLLVIDGAANSNNPDRAGSYFLGHALLPIREEQKANYHVQVTIVPAQQAFSLHRSEFDVCIMVNVAARGPNAPDESFFNSLPEYVSSGHGLLITAGANVNATDYNQVLGKRKLLPAVLMEGERATFQAARQAELVPDFDNADRHGFLGVIHENGSKLLDQLADGFTTRLTQVQDGDATTDGRVLLRFNDGKPLLLTRSLGDGRILFYTTTVDLSWSFLPISKLFGPFINGMVSELIEKSARELAVFAGSNISWKPANKDEVYYLVNPKEERTLIYPLPNQKNEQPSSVIGGSDLPGLYRIVDTSEMEESAFRFVVNPNIEEGDDLDPITTEALDQQLGFHPIQLDVGFDGSEFTGTERSRNEWTIWLLSLLLIFALGETLWAWKCGRAW